VHEAVRRRPALGTGAALLAVSFEPPDIVAGFERELHGELFRLCSDPERRAYGAFGLPRVPTRQLLGWRTLRAYARAALVGRWAWGLGSDVHQMGGDFVLDAAGVLRFAHVSREPGDRPAAAMVLAALAGPTG
jgi:peroxiredoxin